MAYCTNCGNELPDGVVACANCGTAQQAQENAQQQSYSYAQAPVQETKPEVVDKGGFLWGLLGCCVPIAGLILFLIWKDTKPKTAKAAGIGALVYLICMVVYFVLMMVLGIGLSAMGM